MADSARRIPLFIPDRKDVFMTAPAPKLTDSEFLERENERRLREGRPPVRSMLDVTPAAKPLPQTGRAVLRLTRPWRGYRAGAELEFHVADQEQRRQAGELLDRDAAEVI